MFWARKKSYSKSKGEVHLAPYSSPFRGTEVFLLKHENLIVNLKTQKFPHIVIKLWCCLQGMHINTSEKFPLYFRVQLCHLFLLKLYKWEHLKDSVPASSNALGCGNFLFFLFRFSMVLNSFMIFFILIVPG